tara:strand:+ start:1079 stop:2296 length:1218 start_codon:yes stop_codon:yes gene_type:complete
MENYYKEHKGNIKVASIWISGGSDRDSNQKKGINQILSSLLIRGCDNLDNFKLSNFINSYGADLNCETFEDGILLSIKSIDIYFSKVFPILKFIIDKPILSNKQFNICKENIINHIKRSKENPLNIAFDNWRKIVYKNHVYANDPNGYIRDINYINHCDILEEYNNFKKRKKILLSNYFYKNIDNINSFTYNKLFDKNLTENNSFCSDSDKNFRVHYQNINQVIMVIGNKTCSCKNNDFINLKILESYLAFGMSSKLFKIFREQNGLTYDAGVFNPLRKSSAPFIIYLSSSSNNYLKAFNHLLNLWVQITSKIISEEDLNLAKIKLKTVMSLSSQTTEDIINRKVQLMGLNTNPYLDEKFLEKISKVESNEILKTAQKYLKKPSLSICGKEIYCNQIEKIWQNNF